MQEQDKQPQSEQESSQANEDLAEQEVLQEHSDTSTEDFKLKYEEVVYVDHAAAIVCLGKYR